MFESVRKLERKGTETSCTHTYARHEPTVFLVDDTRVVKMVIGMRRMSHAMDEELHRRKDNAEGAGVVNNMGRQIPLSKSALLEARRVTVSKPYALCTSQGRHQRGNSYPQCPTYCTPYNITSFPRWICKEQPVARNNPDRGKVWGQRVLYSTPSASNSIGHGY